jgi:YHS domain-containing protein
MEGLFSLLLFAVFFYLMMRYGCGAHMVHGHGSHGEQDGEQEINHVDPVCGMQVVMDQGYGKMHQGKLYRFCSRSCLDKFEAEPARYLNPPTQDDGGLT